ncbi:hypothetical protein IBX73_00545 [candidate division WOR-3 bacterium]|nr:hypothetical protein [candidate division WOR-3 bacterium]
MKHRTAIGILAFCVVAMAAIAAATGIVSKEGPGPYEYESIRGQTVVIYGHGIYQHMSADVAIQGIAQDYVTLFVGIPLLLIALYLARQGSLRARFLLTGTLGYFLVTYLFYTAMGMYNYLFLAYVFLLGASFFAFALALHGLPVQTLPERMRAPQLVPIVGVFLLVDAVLVALMWLSTVVPPLLDGTIIPVAVQHYTTLIVQGFDLGLLLPMAFVAGLLAVRKRPAGYLMCTVYVVFLSIMMTALTSKLVFMARAGENIIPAIFIIPVIGAISVVFSILLLASVGSSLREGRLK